MVGRLNAPNALTNSGDDSFTNLLPPSTIAAQLVKNHADFARGSRNTDDTATFRQLLQEILSKTSTPETDVEVNHKLIQVVVEAGLDVLFQENPFAQWDILIPQAIDSLAVIKSTIIRQPATLLFADSNPTQALRQPNLLVWLFPKVLLLACHPRADDLQSSLTSLLRCMVSTLSKTLDQWQHSHALLETLRDCVADLMSVPDTSLFLSHQSPVGTALPPGRSLTSLWSEAQQAVALPSGCQMQIRDATAAFKVLLLLLSTMLEIARIDKPSHRLKVAPSALLGWIVDVIPVLTQTLLRHRHYFEERQQFTSLSSRIVQLYGQTFLQFKLLQTTSEDTTPYATVRFYQSCSDYMLASCDRPVPNEVQHQIGIAVQGILNLSTKYNDTVIDEFLLPAVRAFASEESRFLACPVSLQLTIRTLLLASPCSVPDWVATVPDRQGDTAMADATSHEVNGDLQVTGAVVPQRRNLRQLEFHTPRDKVSSNTLYIHLLHQLSNLLGKDNYDADPSIAGLSKLAAYVGLYKFVAQD